MIGSLIDFIIPPECRLCGSPLPEGVEDLCALCAAGLARTGYHKDYNNPMAMRFAGRFPFVKATGHFYYSPDAAVSHLIQDFKYRGAERLARNMGRLMASELELSGFLDDLDWIVPVPLHWTKILSRGYNQVERLARGVSDVCGIPIHNGLKAVRSHRTQTRLNPVDRMKNTAGVFRFNANDIAPDSGILLMDDVCTTGATLSAAAEAVLQAAPTARLTLLTLGVTY